MLSDVLWPPCRPEIEDGDDRELAFDGQTSGGALDEVGNDDQEAKEGNEESPV